MGNIKSYTDLEQSKRLAEILPIESADMVIWGKDLDAIGATDAQKLMKGLKDRKMNYIPCWSLAALLDVLPKYIGDYGKCLYFDMGYYYCGYMVDGDFMLSIEETSADNPIDACVEMIVKLNEQNLL